MSAIHSNQLNLKFVFFFHLFFLIIKIACGTFYRSVYEESIQQLDDGNDDDNDNNNDYIVEYRKEKNK